MLNPAYFQELMVKGAMSPEVLAHASGMAADKENEKGYEIMRQMANMKEVPLPSAATPKIDLKTAAIGSILAGILGNAEGAGGFLQGLIQGNEAKRQQMDQESARKFQMQKMAQDRELGIMRTEAEIANQKANRLLSRQEQFQRKVDEERKRRMALETDKNNFLERLALQKFKTTGELQKMLGFAKQRGIEVPPDLEADLMETTKQAEQSAALAPRIRELYATVKNQDIDPQTRTWSAGLLINGLQADPNLATLFGAHPLEKDRLIQEIQEDAKRATLANKTGQWTLNNLIKEGRIKDAKVLHDTMKNDILKIEKKYADDAFRLENETKKVRIAQIRNGMTIDKQAMDLKKKEFERELKGGLKGRNLLTATAELNAWAKAQNGIIEATGEYNEAEEMIAYWEGVREKVKTGAFRDVTSEEVERSIMFYEAQKRIANGKKIDAENQATAASTKINALKSEIPAQTGSSRAAELRKKYGY